MSEYVDHNDQERPITYSINVKTVSTSKQPLTCCITASGSQISKQQAINQLDYTKPSTCVEKTNDSRIESLENARRSSIHLPVTYSTSINVPCRLPIVKPRPSIILPPQSSHHHYHYYHHHYYHHHHHHRQQSPLSSRPSTTIKHKISPQPISSGSTRPTTTLSTTTSPDSLPSLKKPKSKIHSSLPIPTSYYSPAPPLPSYSALVWNWFHHTPTKRQSHHKSSQSDYSEIYRHELPSKRSLLLKFFTSPIEKQSKTKHHRTCFSRKRFDSSSSLPSKFNNYNE